MLTPDGAGTSVFLRLPSRGFGERSMPVDGRLPSCLACFATGTASGGGGTSGGGSIVGSGTVWLCCRVMP
eukprot:1716265-Rhodomonas_salina.2